MIAINIGVCLFCIFMIGRVGVLGQYLSLIFAFIVGDFSSFILVIIFISTIINILFKKKIDFHHIYFIGGIFIFLGLGYALPYVLIELFPNTFIALLPKPGRWMITLKHF